MEKPEILGIAIFPALVISTLIIALSCGPNPPFAPFGSTVMFVEAPGDILISPNAIEPLEVSAEILNPDGEPLNDVRIIWSLSFAQENSLVFDSDGDTLPDARALQLVDPSECPGGCLNQPLSTWLGFGAFKDSPFETLTDDLGQSNMVILITNPNGTNIVDPATLVVSTGSGSAVVQEFTVNVP